MTFKEYKDTVEGKELLEKLRRKLINRGYSDDELEDEDLQDEIEDSIEAVNDRRHYIPTETKLFEDKYKGHVIRLAICSYSKMGAEGQLAHSENGISRTYAGASEYPNDILKEIVPLGRMKSI